MNLLEKIKNNKPKGLSKEINQEMIEIFIAWTKDELTAADISRYYKTQTGNIYSLLARAGKQYIKNSNFINKEYKWSELKNQATNDESEINPIIRCVTETPNLLTNN